MKGAANISGEAPGAGAVRLERAERRLERLRKVFNHDLPNQLVAIEGLARLLELEEGERLGPEGKELLTRLSSATARLQRMARCLRELARVGVHAERPERVDLAELCRELQAATNQLCPSVRIEYHFSLEAPLAWAGRRPLLQALVELVGGALSAPLLPHAVLKLGSAPAADGVVLWVRLEPPLQAHDKLTAALVEELLADAGALQPSEPLLTQGNLATLYLPSP